MTKSTLAICHWPRLPELPPGQEPVLVRVPTQSSRPAAKPEIRSALREVLAAWSGSSAKRVLLVETPRGPVWEEKLGGEAVDFSLAYGPDAAWIALLRGGRVGVDALAASPVPDWEGVSRNYFSPSVCAQLHAAANPFRAFARAWADLEARLKCQKLGLIEWSPERDARLAGCQVAANLEYGNAVVSVATAGLS